MSVIFQLSRKEKLRTLFAQAIHYPILKTAVICPETTESLTSVLHATDMKVIHPVLIGAVKKMEKIASQLGHRLSEYECIDLEESEAIWKAIRMAKEGEVDALMKGSLSTHALISAVVDKKKGITYR